MTVERLPGLVDVHVHVRDFAQSHKEDWNTATASALAGGVTTILAMPNTQPALVSGEPLARYLEIASARARCDFGVHLGASVANVGQIAGLAPYVTGLKLYLDATFGDLKMDTLDALVGHAASWPAAVPLLAHAEGRTMAAALAVAEITGRRLHVCHVSRRAEIELIARAKARGFRVTCEVCPHHLFLDGEGNTLKGGYCEVRPVLASPDDVAALWEHLAVVDVFATDHAPHTRAEKEGERPPPGFPGLETMLPLLVGAVHDGRLSWDDLAEKLSAAPRRLFDLPAQPDTHVLVDVDARETIDAARLRSKCAWTPFQGWTVRGRVIETFLRGERVYDGDRVTAPEGTGRPVRPPAQPVEPQGAPPPSS